MKRSATMAVLTCAGCVLALTGCMNPDPSQGYTTRSQFRQDVKTVTVPIWRRGTQEFRRDFEIKLTEALVKRIEAETPYKVVDKSRADSILEGTLQSIKQHVLSFDPRTGQAREIQVRLTVDFTWKNLRTGEVMVEKKNFPVTADYIPLSPFREDVFLGTQDALNELAIRIVEQLADKW